MDLMRAVYTWSLPNTDLMRLDIDAPLLKRGGLNWYVSISTTIYRSGYGIDGTNQGHVYRGI